MKPLAACTLFGVLAASGTLWADSDDYALDDGTGEQNVGIGTEFDLAWMNHFNQIGGLDTITDISVAWGDDIEGLDATIWLWDDPNGDGIPDDMAPLTSTSVFGEAVGDGFFKYDITDTVVGSSFFVGVSTTSAGYPMRLDNTTVLGESWVGASFAGNFDGTADSFDWLSINTIDSFGLPGTWMIRANAVPAPGALALLGLAGLVTTRRRRR